MMTESYPLSLLPVRLLWGRSLGDAVASGARSVTDPYSFLSVGDRLLDRLLEVTRLEVRALLRGSHEEDRPQY